MLENMCCGEYKELEQVNSVQSAVNLSNINRVVEVRNIMKNGSKKFDSLFSIKLEDIVKAKNEICLNPRLSKITRILPAKLIKQSFNKDTVQKYLSIDGRNFGLG